MSHLPLESSTHRLRPCPTRGVAAETGIPTVWTAMARWVAVLLASAISATALAASDEPAGSGLDKVERVQVTAPFLEFHTGPGRGYPVFHVAERRQWVSIELRHTDWYKVRASGGQVGWVPREQLASTLTEQGDQKSFRDVLLDDYLRRKVELGAAFGRFKGEPVIRLWTGYRLSDTLSLELSGSQVQGVFSGSSLWQVNVIAEPWSDQRLSPFLGIGLGKFRNVPNQSLVDKAQTDAKLAAATLGARYHLSDRFVLRADYTLYTAFLSDSKTGEYRALAAGLSFFF